MYCLTFHVNFTGRGELVYLTGDAKDLTGMLPLPPSLPPSFLPSFPPSLPPSPFLRCN